MRTLKVAISVLAVTLLLATPAMAAQTFDQAEAGEVRLAVGPANVELDAGFLNGNWTEAAVGNHLAEGPDDFLFFDEGSFD